MYHSRLFLRTIGVWLLSLSVLVPVIQSVLEESPSLSWVEEMDKGEKEGEKEVKDKEVKDSKICLTGKDLYLEDKLLVSSHSSHFAEGDDFTQQHETPPELV